MVIILRFIGQSAASYRCTLLLLLITLLVPGLITAQTTPPSITAVLATTTATCQANGMVSVSSVGGGEAPYQVALVNGPGTISPAPYVNLGPNGAYTFTGVQSGTFTVSILDANGAEALLTAVVGGNYKVMDYTPVPSLAPCSAGNQTGTISVSGLTGGRAPFRYKLTKPTDTGFLANGGVFTGLIPGETYEVQVWDACDNFQTRQVQIPAKDVPSVSDALLQYLDCAGNVKATFTTSGGVAPYRYTITASSSNTPPVGTTNTTGIFSLTSNSTYTVQIADNCGSVVTKNVSLGASPPLTVNTSGAGGTCDEPGSAGGNVKISIDGGIMPYRSVVLEAVSGCTYGPVSLTNLQPDGNGISQEVPNLPRPCAYKVTVTDACGTVFTQLFNQEAAGPGKLDHYDYYNCPSDGSTNIIYAFGASYGPPYAPTAPFSFSLLNSSGNPVAGYPKIGVYNGEQSASLPPGVYTWQIADACGATTGFQSVTIGQYQDPLLVLNAVNQCINAGQVNLIGTNRNPLNPTAGTYAIVSGPNRAGETNYNGVFSNLVSGGAYVFSFNDGCRTVTMSQAVPPYQQPTFEVSTGVLCPPSTVASLQAFNLQPFSKVVGPYTYEIIPLNSTGGYSTPTQTDSLFTGLTRGQYNIRGSDACNNSYAFLGKIGDLPDPVIQASTGPYCPGAPFRIRVAQPVYGATYTYFLDGVQVLTTTAVVAKLPASSGPYTVLVTVPGGCTALSASTFAVQLTGVLTVNSPLTACADQSIDLTASSVTAGSDAGTLSYFQDANATVPLNATTGPANAITKAGDYYIKLTTAASCTNVQKVSLSFAPSFTTSLSSSTVCFGQPATLTATGGVTYLFSSAGSNGNALTVSPATTTTYSVTAINALGCSSIPSSGTVTVLPLPSFTVVAAVCQNLTQYTTSFLVTPGATVMASAGVLLGNQVTGIPTGTNLVLAATLANGCSTTVTVVSPDCPALAASLGDYVFFDADQSGTQTPGDTPIPGVVVTLFLNGSAVATTTTNASGLYSFTGLTPGTSLSYSVGFATPNGYTATTTNTGSNLAIDSDLIAATGRTISYTLSAGQNNTTIDAGFVQLTPTYSIAKSVDLKQVEKGQIVTYTLSVTNTSAVTATSLVLTDLASTTAITLIGSATASLGSFAPTPTGGTWSISALAGGQVASLTYQVQLNEQGITYNTLTAPNGQTATVCTSVPFHVCSNEPFEFALSVPNSFSAYQWSRNGVPIPGATTNTLSATAVGEYSVTSNGLGGCPTGACCPFLIVADPAPSLTALAVSAQCVGQTPQANGAITLVASSTGAVSYNITKGSSFTASAPLFGSPQALSAVVGGVLIGGQPNPALAQDYTIRVYSANGCYADTVVTIQPTVCGCPPEKCAPFVVRKTRNQGKLVAP